MLGNLNGWHLLIVLAVILLLFGAAKLPALAKSVGQSARVFKSEMKEMKRDDEVAGNAPDAPRATEAGSASSVAPEKRASNDTPA
ncbi:MULTISPECIES: Sec-independent protein translocase subunit TatA [Microbacterium]|jgi:sec-independent protein translocase protein TatA|uniref:Sec-independent protein translocase subunit TatA n=1 Tax=Microbacterium TaxID=33882 RepID=UPI001D175989|nr:Sec-independent protein translocase subunit TatA [Microbacterium testaceum]MCC4250207.1 Sec-independent protein translocase subunit TatA [Microbacterium testaceum]